MNHAPLHESLKKNLKNNQNPKHVPTSIEVEDCCLILLLQTPSDKPAYNSSSQSVSYYARH